jgi:hypothetical protein
VFGAFLAGVGGNACCRRAAATCCSSSWSSAESRGRRTPTLAGFWESRRIADFRDRVARGFAILRSRSRYLREVVGGMRSTGRSTAEDLVLPGRIRRYADGREHAPRQSLSILPLTPTAIGTEQALVV